MRFLNLVHLNEILTVLEWSREVNPDNILNLGIRKSLSEKIPIPEHRRQGKSRDLLKIGIPECNEILKIV